MLWLALACSHPSAPADTEAPPAAPWSETVFDDVRITSDASQPDFQKAVSPIDFHDGPFTSMTLTVDLGTTCYPFSGWKSDPPPQGQRWPADCDAFDRNFEFTVDEPAGDGDPPAIEVERAITPFGGPEHLVVDLTDLANGRPGAHALQVYIATWSDGAGQVSGSDGGWNVTARLDAVPGPAPRDVVAVVPLVNTSIGAGITPADVAFQVPDASSTRLEYRVTGHGGATGDAACHGPAEEFCKRTHHLFVDDAEVATPVPWRKDCDQNCTEKTYKSTTYCEQNPCGLPASVVASRANWCPGTETPPIVLTPTLSAGAHTFRYAIDDIADGGTWRVSTVLYAYR